MAASLSRYGRSFATRERGRRLAEEVLVFERKPRVTVDFTNAITAPSFLQGFLGRLGEAAEHITLTGVDERLLPMAERVVKASGLDHKVTVEVPAATAGTRRGAAAPR